MAGAAPPPGFTLDGPQQGPAPPPGFTLDKPADQPSIMQKISSFMGAPDPVAGAGQPLNQQFMDFLNRAITIAPWALGGSIGPEGAMEAGAIKTQAGAAADAAAARPGGPTGPWGPRPEPVASNPQASPTPQGVGEAPVPPLAPMPDAAAAAQAQTSSNLAGGVQQSLNASQAARSGGRFVSPEAPVTNVTGGPAGKLTPASVDKFYGGVNPSAAETNAALREFPNFGLGSRAAPMEPPPPPPGGATPTPPEPSPFGARPPAEITSNEIRAFLKKSGVSQAEIDAAVQEHAAFVKGGGASAAAPETAPSSGSATGPIPTIPTLTETLTKATPKAPSSPRTTRQQQLNAASTALNKAPTAGMRTSSAAAPTSITAPMDIAPATQQAADAFGLIIRRIIRDEIVPHGLAEAGKRFAGKNPGAALSVIKKMVGSVTAIRRLLRIFGLSP